MKQQAINTIDDYLSQPNSISSELQQVSLQLHSHPETSYEEVYAHQLLTTFLESKGFNVTKSACDLSTAFVADWAPEWVTDSEECVRVCFLSEYDALPGIGHACGHNLIAISGVAALMALREAVVTHKLRARLRLLGTPAEEGTGGKIPMIARGALQGVDVALMVHPGRANVTWAKYMALMSMNVIYSGKAAHAAAAPWEGINALDACVAGYNGISMLRQQIHPTSRIHGIIKDGGAAPNVIPERAAAEYYVRTEKIKDLYSLSNRMKNVFKGSALSTGCTVEIIDDPAFADVLINKKLAMVFESHARRLGCEFAPREVQEATPYGSTDMGNVTNVVPGIHPIFDIGCSSEIHTIEFREQAKTEEAHMATIRAAKCLAATGLECILDKELLEGVKAEFSEATKGGR
ncbi:hypothetical protein HDV05_002009 [Chytridiales sp. JEL 0842]|nr:hypothetical protein HDV05_002009 [Chytridiales sp. JEL 0842]